MKYKNIWIKITVKTLLVVLIIICLYYWIPDVITSLHQGITFRTIMRGLYIILGVSYMSYCVVSKEQGGDWCRKISSGTSLGSLFIISHRRRCKSLLPRFSFYRSVWANFLVDRSIENIQTIIVVGYEEDFNGFNIRKSGKVMVSWDKERYL